MRHTLSDELFCNDTYLNLEYAVAHADITDTIELPVLVLRGMLKYIAQQEDNFTKSDRLFCGVKERLKILMDLLEDAE